MHCEPGCSCCAPPTTNAVFLVTINPEARVNVDRVGVRVDPLRPGDWAIVPVEILNQGYVTGPLRMRWTLVPGVEIDAPDTELTGTPVQEAQFRIRLTEPNDADLTIRFWALGALGGLANKNTTSLYIRCRAADNHDRATAAEEVTR